MISSPAIFPFPAVLVTASDLTMVLRLLNRIALLLAVYCAVATPAFSQQAPGRSDDVIRVNAELVQSDFMVFDKQGKFVDGLKRDQFVLKIEGKQREITFFDRITAGSRNEEAQLAAARGNSPSEAAKTGPIPLDRGRTVTFFVDDLHLSASSVSQVRAMLKRFVERDLRQNDQSAIASASGQLGFLQQLTDNKAVMMSAVNRLRAQQSMMFSAEQPPMSEYQALQVEQFNTDVLNFFVDALLKQIPMLARQTAADMVRARASQILEDSSSITARTLGGLKSFIDTMAALPGRKLVFFISDGFFLDRNNSDNFDRLQRITAAAARSGIVIYSLDARGLAAGLPDASVVGAVDPTGRLSRGTVGEVSSSQDAMHALASDTGGKGLFNTNSLSASVATALNETSVYYLLAWRPETEEQRNPKFRRIEVSVIGRPDLTVRFRRGFGESSEEAAKRSKDAASPPARKTSNEEIYAALRAPYPLTSLPVAIALAYLDTAQNGSTLTTTVKVSTSSLGVDRSGDTPTAALDLAGAVLNDQGKSVNFFNKRLTIKAGANNASNHPPEYVFYNHFSLMKPGIYQIRVAAVDVKKGTRGSAHQWIEIPDLKSGELTMSSLMVGEKKPEAEVEPVDPNSKELQKPAVIRQALINVDRRFARSSHLRFLTLIYNAMTGSSAAPQTKSGDATIPISTKVSGPDLAVQVQIFRDNEPVITAPLRRIQTEGTQDLQRIPYAADIKLDELLPGAYVLRVTVVDRLAKSSASQKLSFRVE